MIAQVGFLAAGGRHTDQRVCACDDAESPYSSKLYLGKCVESPCSSRQNGGLGVGAHMERGTRERRTQLHKKAGAQTDSGERFWWRRWGSNPRPQACKARALPAELRPRMADMTRRNIIIAPAATRLTLGRLLSGSGGPDKVRTCDQLQAQRKEIYYTAVPVGSTTFLQIPFL